MFLIKSKHAFYIPKLLNEIPAVYEIMWKIL